MSELREVRPQLPDEPWKVTMTLTERDAVAMHRDRLRQVERGLALILDAFRNPNDPLPTPLAQVDPDRRTSP